MFIVLPSTTTPVEKTSLTPRIINSNVNVGEQIPLVNVVDVFIASYMGGWVIHNFVWPLPPNFTFAMIWLLLVLSNIDVEDVDRTIIRGLSSFSSSSSSLPWLEVRILPQGISGALPNLDLVFAMYSSLQSHMEGKLKKLKSMYYGGLADYRTHPFGGEMEEHVINALKPVGAVIRLKDSGMMVHHYILSLNSVVVTTAYLSCQPHSSALNHGINALTIKVQVLDNRDSCLLSTHPNYANLTCCVEHLLHSISNLHKHLHHSIAQYVMPSPTKFVSHREYIYPLILVSLPMVVRAAMLTLIDLRRFQFLHVGMVLITVCLALLAIGTLAISTDTRQLEKDASNFSADCLHWLLFSCGRHCASRQIEAQRCNRYPGKSQVCSLSHWDLPPCAIAAYQLFSGVSIFCVLVSITGNFGATSINECQHLDH